MNTLVIYADPDEERMSKFHVDSEDDFSVIDANEDYDEKVRRILEELSNVSSHLLTASNLMREFDADIELNLRRKINTTSVMSLQCDVALAALMLLSADMPVSVSFRTEYEKWDCVSTLICSVIDSLDSPPTWLEECIEASGVVGWSRRRPEATVEFMRACAEHERNEKREAMERLGEILTVKADL